MHPINNKNFGPGAGKLSVKFYDGSAVVTGYIVKQMGTATFRVAKADGSGMKVCRLAKTTSEITALTAGTGDDSAKRDNLCTVEIAAFGGATENVRSIQMNSVVTVQGSKLAWGETADAAGEGDIGGVANAAPTVANAIPDQAFTVVAGWSFTFAANTFADTNMDALTYTATLSTDAALPAEIVFVGATRTFTVAANSGLAAATYSLKVTASDGTASVSDTFDVVVS